MTLRDALEAPDVLGAAFAGPSWHAWRTVAAVLEAGPLDQGEAELYQRCTGRTVPPTGPARELWAVCGRRSGKSRFAAAAAVHAAVTADRSRLAPGEVGTVLVCAVDVRGARVIFDYARGLLEASPLLAPLLTRATSDALELANGCRIEVRSSNFRSVRGVTLLAGILDEVAFLRDEQSANPDLELYRALRPALATTGGRILGLSSPWARRGLLFTKYKRHFGRDDDGRVVVWQAPSLTMHPGLDAELVAEARDDDAEAASAEWDACFRSDLESFAPLALLEALVSPGVVERPPRDGVRYVAFVDVAGGTGGDSFTAAVAHAEAGPAGERVVVLDALYEARPPFDPLAITADVAGLLERYGVTNATADKYAGAWVSETFTRHGVVISQDAEAKSAIYLAALPLLTSRKVELLDSSRLLRQLAGLERRRRPGGRDVVDHAPGGHDDLANAAAGGLVAAAAGGECVVLGSQPRPRYVRAIGGWQRPFQREVLEDV